MTKISVEVSSCFCGDEMISVMAKAKVVGDHIHFINEPCHFVNTESKEVKMQEIEYEDIVRRPFKVKAVQITAENITELARYIGDLERDDDGNQFILVDRRKVPSIEKVFVGYWMTRMGKQTRVYAERIFKQQFMTLTPSVQEWMDFLDKEAADNA